MDLRQVAEKDPNYPAVLFFYQGTIADGNTFFMHLWPSAVAVADPALKFYKAFGVPRGGLKEMFAPQVWTCGLRAARKGHMIGRPVGSFLFPTPDAFSVAMTLRTPEIIPISPLFPSGRNNEA